MCVDLLPNLFSLWAELFQAGFLRGPVDTRTSSTETFKDVSPQKRQTGEALPARLP